MSEKTGTYVAVIISAVWAFSMVWDGVDKSYDPPAAIYGAFTLVLGLVFGARALNGGGGK